MYHNSEPFSVPAMVQEASVRQEVLNFEKDPSAGAIQGLSSVKMRHERMLKQRQLAALSQDVAGLPALLRLVDVMTAGSAVALLGASIQRQAPSWGPTSLSCATRQGLLQSRHLGRAASTMLAPRD